MFYPFEQHIIIENWQSKHLWYINKLGINNTLLKYPLINEL